MSGLNREEDDKPSHDFANGQCPFGAPIRTPPPGFLGSSSGVLAGASLSSFAESLRAASASAPPPPGFGIAPDQRQLNNSSSDGYSHPLFLQPSDFANDNDSKKRTKSFVNLAAALGEGLAECMDDSFADAKQQMLQQSNKLSPTETNTHVEIDNFARQSRHTVSRLIGSSTGHEIDSRSLHSQNLAEKRNSASSSIAAMKQNMRNSLANSNNGVSATDNIFTLSSSSSNQTNTKYFQATSLSNNTSSNNIISVVEPSSRNSPAPRNGLPHNYASFAESFSGGRASAPPHMNMNDPQPRQFAASPATLRSQTASSLQKRVNEFRSLRQGSINEQNITHRTSVVEFAKTPEPSFDNAPNFNSLKHQIHEPNFENDRELELHSVNLLATFLVQPGTGESKIPSRALVILFASRLNIPDVRSTCEAFGSLLYFRSEFSKSRGIIFVAYHDLRSAHHASEELKSCLKRLAVPHNDVCSSSSQDDIEVMHCISLDSCSAKDPSTINLSNLPAGVDDRDVRSMMASFGAVRSVQIQAEGDGESDVPNYSVEFFDTQDAAQAMLEIENTMPWGPGVNLEVKTRNILERKQGQELLSLIGRWRRGENTDSNSVSTQSVLKDSSSFSFHNPANTSTIHVLSGDNVPSKSASPLGSSTSSTKATLVETTSVASSVGNQSNHTPSLNNSMRVAAPEIAPGTFQASPQLVLGPDGQYTYMLVDHSSHLATMQPTYMQHQQPKQTLISPQQQFIGAPIGAPNAGFVTPMHSSIASQTPNYHDGHHYYLQHHPHSHHIHSVQPQFLPSSNVVAHTQYVDARTGHPIPVYTAPVQGTNMISSQTDSSISSTSSGHVNGVKHMENRQMNHQNGVANMGGNGDTATHLELDIDAVKRGEDTRTSVMVRNIPNKYTQRMLLAEFTECGHGSDKIDFLYLPIDFKNKCNRGYAFVNFVDFRDIFHFYKKYNGQSWKVFNSDKICKITYARIQGKAGMLKRFENSALMEKDHEYRPIVFVSHGPRKGQLEDFPTPST